MLLWDSVIALQTQIQDGTIVQKSIVFSMMKNKFYIAKTKVNNVLKDEYTYLM